VNDKPRSFKLRGAHGLEPDQALLNVPIYAFPEYFRLMLLPSLAFHLHELLSRYGCLLHRGMLDQMRFPLLPVV
jgi:hypothetical protein